MTNRFPPIRQETPFGGTSSAATPAGAGARRAPGLLRRYSANRTARASARPGRGATSRAVRMVLAL